MCLFFRFIFTVSVKYKVHVKRDAFRFWYRSAVNWIRRPPGPARSGIAAARLRYTLYTLQYLSDPSVPRRLAGPWLNFCVSARVCFSNKFSRELSPSGYFIPSTAPSTFIRIEFRIFSRVLFNIFFTTKTHNNCVVWQIEERGYTLCKLLVYSQIRLLSKWRH